MILLIDCLVDFAWFDCFYSCIQPTVITKVTVTKCIYGMYIIIYLYKVIYYHIIYVI